MEGHEFGRRKLAATAGLVIGLGGAALLCAAWWMDVAWAEQHLLPVWSFPWDTQLRILLPLRLAIAGAGVLVLVVFLPWMLRRIAARRARETFWSILSGCGAVGAAFVVAELIVQSQSWELRHHNTRILSMSEAQAQERRARFEPLEVSDPAYGWKLAPNHAGTAFLHNRTVRYATGPFGYRVEHAGGSVDFSKPTVVFAGESVILGYALQFRETIPAQVQAITGVQTANLGVNAFATDQTYLRLRRELPRFSRPVAVVVPFIPSILDRDLDRDRPYLDAELHWHHAEPPAFRLVELGRRLVRYRSSAEIADAIRKTQGLLRQTITLARARGAQAIVVVPQFLPESYREAAIRRAVLDNGRIPYLLVPLKREWRFPRDGHPTPEGARAIAVAIVKRLGLGAS